MRYAEKVYGLEELIDKVRDRRSRPQIATRVVFGGVVAMMLTRLGSLHALEQFQEHSFLVRWLGRRLGSADTTGRVFARIEADTIRAGIRRLYARLKRNKALPAGWHGLVALVVDGHESSASYLRCCRHCLVRRIRTATGEQLQYYHRHVTGILVGGGYEVLLDCEPQRKGEDEVAAAMRLMNRLLENFPRAFQVVVADGLYAQARFFRLVLSHHKDVIAVLKDEARDLLEDARGLFGAIEPVVAREGGTRYQWWDIEHFDSWPQVGRQVRVVRSRETTAVRRQKDGTTQELVSDWVWVTTLRQDQVSTRAVVELGHGRWRIENQGFNELVNEWHADHVYKHDVNAIEAFWLATMLAYNLFHVFVRRNLKPVLRQRHTIRYWARAMLADLYQGVYHSLPPVPI